MMMMGVPHPTPLCNWLLALTQPTSTHWRNAAGSCTSVLAYTVLVRTPFDVIQPSFKGPIRFCTILLHGLPHPDRLTDPCAPVFIGVLFSLTDATEICIILFAWVCSWLALATCSKSRAYVQSLVSACD